MQAIFIRHGSAEPARAGAAADRKLTEEGFGQVRATAEALKALGVKLEVILTSPLVRAAQTAGAVAELHGNAAIAAAEFLAPPCNTTALRQRLAELAAAGTSAVGLVGHTPSLEACIAQLVTGTRQAGLSLSTAGAACVEIPPAEASDPPELLWLMRREQLAMLARAGRG